MSITKVKKQEIFSLFQLKQDDTGSCEVQIALCSERIKNLTDHHKANPKDFSSHRGLLKLVSKRRTLLKYLKAKAFPRYETLIQRLNLKK